MCANRCSIEIREEKGCAAAAAGVACVVAALKVCSFGFYSRLMLFSCCFLLSALWCSHFTGYLTKCSVWSKMIDVALNCRKGGEHVKDSLQRSITEPALHVSCSVILGCAEAAAVQQVAAYT